MWMLAGLAACGGAEEAGRAHAIGTDPRVYVSTVDGGHQAEISGRVIYEATSRCLLLDTGSATGVIWPIGSTPVNQNGKRGVNVPGVGPILEGEAIRAAGGGVSSANWPEIDEEMPDCRPNGHAMELFTVDEVS